VLLRYFGVGDYLTLSYIQNASHHFKLFVEKHYWSSVFFYILSGALLIIAGFPYVSPLTLLGGFLFGVIPGTLYAVTGSTIGSVLSFFIMRHLFGARLQERYKDKLAIFNRQMKEHGSSYLLVLHYVTVIPFLVINTLAALTNVSFWTFLWTTVLGSLPLAFIYSYAGLKLGSINKASDIFSPPLILSLFLLILLSLVPVFIKWYQKKYRVEKDALL